MEQQIPRMTLNWNGDVWKAFVECRTKPILIVTHVMQIGELV